MQARSTKERFAYNIIIKSIQIRETTEEARLNSRMTSSTAIPKVARMKSPRTNGKQPAFFFFFSSCFMSICNPLGYDRPEASLHYIINMALCPFFLSIFALPSRYNLARLLGISPPEFIQVSLHLLGRFSVPIPAPSPLPLLFLLSLSPSKTLAMAPLFFIP